MIENSIFGNVGGGGLGFPVNPCGLKRELRKLIAPKITGSSGKTLRLLNKKVLRPVSLGESVIMKPFLILIILLFEVPTGNLSKCTMKS